MTNASDPQPSPPPAPHEPQGPHVTHLPLHTTVVLLTAAVIGLVIGALTALTGVPVAAAVIAGLASSGSSIPVLRSFVQ
ncbi:hypothetical protein ACIP5U_39065 [Streptomyces sp. NPDC088788]|uniref:hypothetical protein n=1 Tax=Streptomyces sp. NPDC088788 TaxID=3365898 RepID=UPI00381C0AFC